MTGPTVYVSCSEFFVRLSHIRSPYFFWLQDPEYPLEKHLPTFSGHMLLIEVTPLLIGCTCDRAWTTRVSLSPDHMISSGLGAK